MAAAAVSLGSPPEVAAQQPQDPDTPGGAAQEGLDAPRASRRIVWMLDTGALATDEARALAAQAPALFIKALGNSGDTHFVAMSAEDLARRLKRSPQPTPPCLQGQAPCASPTAVMMQAIGADLLLRGKLTNAGPRWSLEVEMIGPTGNQVLTRTLTAGGVPDDGQPVTPQRGLEELVYKAARELFQSTGALEITTRPEGAAVKVDGQDQGVSPLVMELPVGTHEVEIILPDHAPLKRTVEVVAGGRAKVEANLDARMATLTVDSTPVLGEVFIDNKPMGTAGSPMRLAPGEYELEVRAEGYKVRTQRLILAPEELKVVSLTLERARPNLNITSLGEVETEAILARNYFARASYRFTSLSTSLADGEGRLGDDIFKIDGLLSADAQGRRDFGFHGLHLEVGYHWEHLGLVALGLSIFSSGDRAEANLASGDNALPGVDLDEFGRVEIKPAQLIFRYPYQNLFPSIQTGFGYYNNTFTGNAGDRGTLDMEQDGFFWHFAIEASYFFDTWWYGYTSLGAQRDLSVDDTSTQLMFSLGVGITFENPFQNLGAAEPPKEY